MLRVDFVTLFPEMIEQALSHSILSRAARSGAVRFGTVDPRAFTSDAHRTVDEKPYGGGPGMLMKPEPLDRALRSLELDAGAFVVFPEPTGAPYTQAVAAQLASGTRIVIVCGHYEGIDERIPMKYATHRVSLGDFVVTGGELPGLLIADSVVRLLPNVLGCSESLEIDSHSDGLLSAPQYTRPEVFEEHAVPEVLRSGDHKAVETWKRREALKHTRSCRPDLFCRAKLEKKDVDLLSS
jgi:tRNA (guanine37-N1)-methyltransferase